MSSDLNPYEPSQTYLKRSVSIASLGKYLSNRLTRISIAYIVGFFAALLGLLARREFIISNKATKLNWLDQNLNSGTFLFLFCVIAGIAASAMFTAALVIMHYSRANDNQDSNERVEA